MKHVPQTLPITTTTLENLSGNKANKEATRERSGLRRADELKWRLKFKKKMAIVFYFQQFWHPMKKSSHPVDNTTCSRVIRNFPLMIRRRDKIFDEPSFSYRQNSTHISNIHVRRCKPDNVELRPFQWVGRHFLATAQFVLASSTCK